jgi:hypothetical protein
MERVRVSAGMTYLHRHPALVCLSMIFPKTGIHFGTMLYAPATVRLAPSARTT